MRQRSLLLSFCPSCHSLSSCELTQRPSCSAPAAVVTAKQQLQISCVAPPTATSRRVSVNESQGLASEEDIIPVSDDGTAEDGNVHAQVAKVCRQLRTQAVCLAR
mmetsp:Transcript_719/g.2101  ORF Transcript_719/g.2101 Transcript_719/m.2101 type:complete len:105 (+) Transcript_719:371-685(+)